MLNEPSDLGAAGLVADRYAAKDAARMAELDWLIKRGRGNEAPKETTMNRACCASKGPRHLKTCPTQAQKSAPAKVRALPVKRARSKPAGSTLIDVEEITVKQLVETIAACREELGKRKEQLQSQLDLVAEAIGSAA